MVLRAPIEEVEIGDADGADTGMGFVEHNEAGGIGVGQRAQQRVVDNGENRGVRADGQRERDKCHAGEAGILAERSESVAEVLAEGFESPNAARFTALFLDLAGAAEVEADAPTRFFWR